MLGTVTKKGQVHGEWRGAGSQGLRAGGRPLRRKQCGKVGLTEPSPHQRRRATERGQSRRVVFMDILFTPKCSTNKFIAFFFLKKNGK